MHGFSSISGGGQLHTADTSLDLTGVSASLPIYSTNAAGTTFTTDNLQTASEIRGGAGTDTLVYTNATHLTDAQLADIFAQGSVEVIQEGSAIHVSNVQALTTNNDPIQGTSSDLVVTATASTLNPGDQLIGGTGHNTLALYGPGSFDLTGLAAFSGFQEVDLVNDTGGTLNVAAGVSTVALRGDSNIDVYLLSDATVTETSSSSIRYHATAGNYTITTSDYDSVSLSGGTSTINLNNAQSDYIDLGSGTYSISGTAVINDHFVLGTGSYTGTISIYANSLFDLGEGSYDLALTSAYSYGFSQTTINLGTGTYSIHGYITPYGYGTNYYVSDPAQIHAGDVLQGGQSLNLNGSGEFDLTQASFSGIGILSVQGTADVTTSVVHGFSSISGGGQLHTADTSLDLTGVSASLPIYSTNAAGTTFTTDNLQTASEIRGGAGTDTLVYTNATPLTDTQRADIFAQGSVEVIREGSVQYAANVTGVTLSADSAEAP